ncbi:Nrap protein [Peniophora sp. CONT]|nr:Nrap protein [Peniophora sp. CONT]
MSALGDDHDEEMSVDGEEEGGGESGDEEFAGFGGVGSASGAASRGGKPKKAPTGSEVRAIKDAAELFRSSSFKLQIDALLPNVRLKPSRRAAIDRSLLTLHTALTSAPSFEPETPLSAARKLLKKKHVATPWAFPSPAADANWKVSFDAPSEVTLVGSYALQTSVKPPDGLPWTLDLAVSMPSALFQEKDYLNGRFAHKRAFFLAALAAHLVEKGYDVQWSAPSSDARATVLLLDLKIPKVDLRIRLIAILPTDSPILLAKLAPHRANLRITGHENAPTPLYNTSIMQATTPRAHLLAMHALKEDVPAYADALALLRVWAVQRAYGSGALSIAGFESRGQFWSALLEALVRGEEPFSASAKSNANRKPLGKGLSSYQLFRAALAFLAEHDWDAAPVFVKAPEGHRFPQHEYVEHHGPALVDSSSRVNVLAGVPHSSLTLLKHDAQTTLATLNAASEPQGTDSFAQTFLLDARPLPTRFDVVLHVSLAHAKPLSISPLAIAEHGSPSAALIYSISSTLSTALGTRVKALALLHAPAAARQLDQPDVAAPQELVIGLLFDPVHATRLVDLGPAATQDGEEPTESQKEFAALWGERAEVRRFKDGSIAHAAVWDSVAGSADTRARLPATIATFILNRHFAISAEDVVFMGEGFDQVLRLPKEIVALGGRQAGFAPARAAFDAFAKVLRALPEEDMPLSITAVSPTSAYLRGTAPLAPLAAVNGAPSAASYVPTMDIVLELARAGRWPDDVAVAGKMKLAVLERLARALMGSGALPGVKARVTVPPPGASPLEDHVRLEVVTKDGWAFSLAIDHPRTAVLLQRAITSYTPLTKSLAAQIPKEMQAQMRQGERDAENAKGALENYERMFVARPRLHRVLAALGHKESAFGGACRLVKRWFAAHWLLDMGSNAAEGGMITEEAVELLVARAFLVGDAPASRERGFARVVRWLANWDWATGVRVPLFDEPDPAHVTEEAKAQVEVEVKGGVWRIMTAVDEKGTMWTARGPDALVARRVREIARATWDAMKEGSVDVQSLFVHPTDDYDFVLQLEPSALPRHFEAVAPEPAAWGKRGKYANTAIELTNGSSELRPGWDPARAFVSDLRNVYADTLRLFYDTLGGTRVGGVWEPALREPRPWRVLGRFSAVPVQTEDDADAKKTKKGKDKDTALVVLNEAAVVDEIVRMGWGLVRA